jgi:hypothetical protein
MLHISTVYLDEQAESQDGEEAYLRFAYRLQRLYGSALQCLVRWDVLRYSGSLGTVVLHQYVLHSSPIPNVSAN